MPKVMKPATPRDRGKPRGRNHIDWHGIFAEAHKAHPWQWVRVYEWRSLSGAYRAQRAIGREDAGCDVPGGVKAWETRVDGETGKGGKVRAFLYVKKIRGGRRG